MLLVSNALFAQPVATCNNLTAYLNTSGGVNVNAIQVGMGSGGTSPYTYQINGAPSRPFTCAEIGANNVLLTVTDAVGATSTCAAIVTVIDSIPPSISCPSAITVPLNSSGNFTVNQSIINSLTFPLDNCGNTTVSINGQSSVTFSCANIGMNNVTLIITDLSGNTATCSSVVTIIDTTQPIAICPSVINQFLNNGTVNVNSTQIDLGSVDNCGIAMRLINGASFQTYTCANLGANTAILTVTDLFGNTATCSSIVNVLDINAPIPRCQNITVPLDSLGNATVTAAQIDNGSTDNCSIATLLINNLFSINYHCPSPTTQVATLMVRDSAGNMSTCNSLITFVHTPASQLYCSTNNLTLEGIVYGDNNVDCNFNGNDSTLGYVNVQAVDTSGMVYQTYTNAQGYYHFVLPKGQYIVSSNLGSSIGLYLSCVLDTINLDSVNNPNDTLNIGFQPVLFCPLLDVDIVNSFLRRCPGTASIYNVYYHNRGTAMAANAYLDIDLDPFVIYQSSSIPAMNIGGNTYRFQLGNIAVGGHGTIYIYVNLDCSAIPNQVHCTDAHIYPDTSCLINPNLPFITILDSCLVDSILFRLTNIGGDMATPQNYEIIEDDLMYRPSTPFQLNTNQSIDITIPVQAGKVYRIEVEQNIGLSSHLVSPITYSIVQNCSTFVNTTTNFINQFYTNGNTHFTDNLCQPNVGAYDPNVKVAQPIGYGANHYVNPSPIPFEYQIHFQNTGNDTAFTVVITDTLDNDLDVSSIVSGASSHPYTWQLKESKVIEFTFNNILLVDSFTNESASHGYVAFEIKQKPNLPLGTHIENTAAIYFDANAPVITNTVFHNIATDFITLVSNNDISLPNVQVKVYPNPFQDQTTLEVSGIDFQQIQLRLVDVMGKEIQVLQSGNNKIVIQREQLPQGVYFYQLFAEDKLLNTGKIIAQ